MKQSRAIEHVVLIRKRFSCLSLTFASFVVTVLNQLAEVPVSLAVAGLGLAGRIGSGCECGDERYCSSTRGLG